MEVCCYSTVFVPTVEHSVEYDGPCMEQNNMVRDAEERGGWFQPRSVGCREGGRELFVLVRCSGTRRR